MKFFAIILLVLILPHLAHAEEVTASVLLRNGTILTDADVNIKTEAQEDVQAVRSAYIGQQLKRTIYAGQKINKAHVGAPILVKRNATVTMVYQHGALKLTAKGRALSAGAMGDTISILNASSRKKVFGTVSGHELVEITQ